MPASHARRAAAAIAIAACAMAPAAPAAAAVEYAVTDLGALDDINSWGWAISDRGEVAGWSTASGGVMRAFRWDRVRGMRSLGTLPGTGTSYALGINDAGAAAGYAGLSFEVTRAFRSEGRGRRVRLVELPAAGGDEGFARAINDRGDVAGEADTADGGRHVVVWEAGGGLRDLGSLPGEPFATGDAINELGVVAGNAGRPFLVDGDAVTVLPSLGGKSLVRALNDFGAAAGSSALGTDCPTCDTRAARWAGDGTVTEIGLLAPPGTPAMTSVAQGLNNAGEVVGWSTTVPLGAHHGFVCRGGCPGGPQDLNDLVPAGWLVSEATAINNAGEIVALGASSPGGLQRALLLSPLQPRPTVLTPVPRRAGAINRFALRGLSPGAETVLWVGSGPGASPGDGCGGTLDIADARELGRAVADADGEAMVRVRLPAGDAGRVLYLQATDTAACRSGAPAVHRVDPPANGR